MIGLELTNYIFPNIDLLGAEKNFITYKHGLLDTMRMPYDIHSLMHYENKAFTKNFADTIQAKKNPEEPLGGKRLSTTGFEADIAIVQM